MLESPRLILRPLSVGELITIADREDHRITPALDPGAVTDQVHSSILKKLDKMQAVHEDKHFWYTYWLIISRETGEGIGFIGFKGAPDENGLSEVGYGLSGNYRRRGLMTEALRLMIGWASANPLCKGITAMNVLKTNTGSQKVLEHCGFRLSGSSEETCDYILLFSGR